MYFWYIEYRTFIDSSFRILNSSAGIASPLLTLLIVMLPKAHLKSHSRMSGSRWVTTPMWLSGSLRPFLYSSSFFLEMLVIALHSSIIAYWTLSYLGDLIFWCCIFLPFPTVHGVLWARILEWFAIPSSSGPWFVRTLYYGPSVLGGPAHHGSFSSVVQSCLTPYDSMDCSTPGFPVHHQLPELTQTQIHRVSDAIQPSHPLWSPSPPAFNLSQHQGLFNESVLHIKWPKYCKF